MGGCLPVNLDCGQRADMAVSFAHIPARVLMIGPDLSLHGGIVSVVDGYLKGGLPAICDSFEYLGTGLGFTKIGKFWSFIKTLTTFKKMLPLYDIVHLHISARGSYWRKSIMARLAHKAGKRVILHDHDGEFAATFEKGGGTYRRNVRETFDLADCVLVLSEEWCDYFAENVCDRSKIVILHNSVKAPENPCTPRAHQDVLFLGRLDARKSPDILLRAAAELVQRYPGVRYRFCGDGEVARYQVLADSLGIADQCDFTGWVNGEEREAIIRDSGIFCLPSRNEGMPMSMLEMMAYGLPCVVTPVGGIPQVIEDGKNGFMVPVGDERLLASRLGELLESPSLRAEIGRNAREMVSERFGIEKSIVELGQIYADL